MALETSERHLAACLFRKSPFGNEATTESPQRRGSRLKRGHFNEQLPLYLPCGPIHCRGRGVGCSGVSFETFLLIIRNMYRSGPGSLTPSVDGGRVASAGLGAVCELVEENQSGVGIVKWPVAQVVRKQALHIKLSLY